MYTTYNSKKTKHKKCYFIGQPEKSQSTFDFCPDDGVKGNKTYFMTE